MTTQHSDLPVLGSRFDLQGYRGTVRYVGPVDGATGVWIGAEFDVPERGKHSGERDGRRYFTCRTPGSGAFIRPSSAIQYGVPFLDALISKYVEEVRGGDSNEFVTLGSSQGAIQVEAVNLDKIRSKFAQLGNLREISLDGELVALCGASPDKIRSTCCSARGLDLSRTLFSRWCDISRLCSQMVRLERLSLNQNRFYSFTLAQTEDPPAFINLGELRLNATLMTWSEVQEIVCWMPRLKALEMGHNRISSLDSVSSTSGRSHPDLASLNLDNNTIEDLPAAAKALDRCYPSLHRLVLGANAISAIEHPDQAAEGQSLRKLTHLVLSSNALSRWPDIHALTAWFPRLEALSMMGNPIGDQPYARQIIIAVIPSLLRLDSTAISSQERKDSEILYLSLLTRGVDLSHSAAHIQRLSAAHGVSLQMPSPLSSRKPSDSKLVNQLIGIELVHRPPVRLASGNEMISRSIHVLPTMTLRVFKMKVRKAIGVSPKEGISLFLEMPDQMLVPLAEESQELAWWGIEDGNRIVSALE